ncbi:MAG: bifunctional tetrahydrofolate synthase/dihydrofolate synthase [Candidatus Eutrophobiaceae bacterium]
MKRSPQKSNQRTALRFLSLPEWLAWQETLHYTAIELGLERCRKVADTMGLLHPNCHVISVGGTNGKGSSVELLRLILSHAGYRVGSYTSPHLLRYNERIVVDGAQVADDRLCESFTRIDQARGDISLTYFEFGTLAALDIFRHEKVDLILLEVGLGGRLDAVNVIDADIVLITSIDLDHQHWLGNDRESIGREKSGIFRNHSPAICADLSPPQSLVQCAEALGTPLSIAGLDYHFHIGQDTWNWLGEDTQHLGLPHPMRYCDQQIQNAASVLQTLEKISHQYPVRREDIIHGMRHFRLPGRFQMLSWHSRRMILDVAHNKQAAKMLSKSLNQLKASGRIHAILGTLKDKDHRAICTQLKIIVDEWHLVDLPSERSNDTAVLEADLRNLGVECTILRHASIPQALNAIDCRTKAHDTVLVTGSFLTVGGVLRTTLLQTVNPLEERL